MQHPRALRTLLAFVVVSALLGATGPRRADAAASDLFPAIKALWERTDSPQARGDRPFVWGPQPTLPAFAEPLAGVPGDQRTVLYWDKSRMEVNDPTAPLDQWYITNGLLVAEMVSGRQQIGVNPTRYAERAPAEVPFGDLDDPTGPTFRSFAARLADAPLAPGQAVAQGLERAGVVTTAEAGGVTCAVVVAATRHCVADVFAAFLDATGPIYDGGIVRRGRLFDPPYYATGLPISEPYWITVRAGGVPTRVLIQLFERRTLTYNPANDPASRVEMGNVGLEYFHWRYDVLLPDDAPTGFDPALRAVVATVWDAAPEYRPLLQNLAGGRYALLPQDLGQLGAYGTTANEYRVILLDHGLLAAAGRNPARILAHETQHAADFGTFGTARNAAECYAVEARGFLTEAALWQRWYGPAGKADPADQYERNANAILARIRDDPAAFAARLRALYADECAPLGPGSGEQFLTTRGLPAGLDGQLPVAALFAALR